MTDHAKNQHTDGSIFYNLLKLKDLFVEAKLARTLQYSLHLQPIARN